MAVMLEGDADRKIIQCCGGCVWIALGVAAFMVLLTYIPVSGVTTVPAYARSLLYLSVGHHLSEVDVALKRTSPPPPNF